MKSKLIALFAAFLLMGCNVIPATLDKVAEMAGMNATPTPAQTLTPLPTRTPLPTLFPTAKRSMPPTRTPVPVDSNILYADDFSNTRSGWWELDDEYGTTYYSEGRYFMSAFRSDFFYWVPGDEEYASGVLNIDICHISGNDQRTGAILFWHLLDNENFYALFLSDDGQFYVMKKVDGHDSPIYRTARSDFLNTKGEENKVSISFNGEGADIYFNDQLAASIQEDALEGGTIALGVSPSKLSDTLVAFDNLVVYKYGTPIPYTPSGVMPTHVPDKQPSEESGGSGGVEMDLRIPKLIW